MKMTKDQFELLHLRPALYDGTIMTMNVAINDESFWRTEAKIAIALGLKSGDTVEILGDAVDYNEENHRYCYEKFYMNGELLTKFIEKFGFKKIKANICFSVKFRYLHIKSDNELDDDKEILAFEVLDFNLQDETFSCESDTSNSASINDYLMDGMK